MNWNAYSGIVHKDFEKSNGVLGQVVVLASSNGERGECWMALDSSNQSLNGILTLKEMN